DRVALLLAAAWVAAALVGVFHLLEQVVTVEGTAGGGGHAVDPLGLLVGAAGEVRLERQHVARAVVGVFDGLVVGRARRAIDIRFNRLGRASEVVIIGLVNDATRVGDRFHPPRIVVGVARHQNGVGATWHAAGAGVGRATVGADVDAVGQAVGEV